jgi:DNA-directed RNA polymerase specialized sigma24 family protein
MATERTNGPRRLHTVAPQNITHAEHRGYVLRALAWRTPWLAPTEREAILHDAYALLLAKHRDGALDVDSMLSRQLRAYLVQAALNKAMDERKRAARRRAMSLDDEQQRLDPPDPAQGLCERVASALDAAHVREIIAELSGAR